MANSSDENEAVFCPATLKLGEMHWYILRASHEMYVKTTVEKQADKRVGTLTPIRLEDTEFGKEVGRDEINWWIFRKERNIQELQQQTARAFDAAQKLKEQSKLLRARKPTTYPELLETLRRFAEVHSAEIETLYGYVRWLESRNSLAPAILFTYRVWGSTRMGDRTVKLDERESQPSTGTVRRLTELILGLTNSLGTPVLFTAHYEVGSEIWERMADSEEGGSSEITVPMDRVAHRASYMAFDEFAEYFQLIRDSLRNILLDIENFIGLRDLLNDDGFWRAFVEKAVQTKKIENQLWDFKETLKMWHTTTSQETERAKVSFAEDAASFANARGGVLILGVTDNRQVVGIGTGRELENRLKFASDVLSKHLEYGREITRLRQIVLRGEDGQDKTCLVVVISQACQPVAVHDGAGHYTYPVRRETGLTRVSRNDILDPKSHMKSDNCDFLGEIEQFVHDR